MKKFYLQIYRHTPSINDEDSWVDVNSLGIHPDMAQLLADLGIVENRQGSVPARQVRRVQKIIRLRRGLGVNLPGAVIILDLLERIEKMQEIDRLKRR